MRGAALAVVALVGLMPVTCAGGAPTGGERSTLSLRVVARGLSGPLHVASTPSEPTRIYIVEQVGRIRVLVNGRLRAAPFLDIRNLVKSGGEQGLFSIAFHPKYAQNRRFYVDYTDVNGDTRVVEYRSNGQRAVLSTRRQLMFVDQPYANHNGGQLAFGPDARLYVGMGDGGSGGDPQNFAQRLNTLLGKLVTINVDRRGARPQVDALGLRNPWRFSFDRANGDLYIGDVGQGAWEEIDYTPRGQLRTLRNYGWSTFEGRARFSDRELARGRLVEPVHVYARAGGECSVTGGFVYRGRALAAQRGRYFFGDYCSGKVWSLRVSQGQARDVRLEPFQVSQLSSFGEDVRGELYLTSLAGTVYRLVD